MAYSTPAMVRNALHPSTDAGVSVPSPASNTAADFTDAELNDAIAEADSTINGYLTSRYAVPVADGTVAVGVPPHPIDFWSRNIAAYLATLTYRGSLDFTDTDPVVRRYKDTMDALKAVEAGTMNLPLPENAGAGSSVAAASPYNPYIGDLWTPDDFSLRPAVSPSLNPSGGWGPFWQDPSGL